LSRAETILTVKLLPKDVCPQLIPELRSTGVRMQIQRWELATPIDPDIVNTSADEKPVSSAKVPHAGSLCRGKIMVSLGSSSGGNKCSRDHGRP
jgi:hypothetical protein